MPDKVVTDPDSTGRSFSPVLLRPVLDLFARDRRSVTELLQYFPELSVQSSTQRVPLGSDRSAPSS